MATVFIPTPLRRLTDGEANVEVRGVDIAAVMADLNKQFPDLNDKLMDEDGEVRRFINVFVNNNEIRTLQGTATPVAKDDTISIVPAMAGG